MKISEIKINPNNPRVISDERFEKLKKSIEEFPKMMKLRPMVVNQDNVVLGGNMRLKALKELGYKEIPDDWVKRADELTEDEQRRFIIVDNVGFGDNDWEMLRAEWDLSDLEDWGVDIEEWDNYSNEQEAEDDNFEVPDQIETDIVVGDLFEIGNHRLLCGDATDSDQVAKLMNGELADMVFTDPPYDIKDQSYSNNIYLFTENAHVFLMHDDRGIVEYLKESQLLFDRFFVAKFSFAQPRGNDPYLRHILISHEKKGKPIKHQNMHDGLSSIIPMEYRGTLKEEKIHDHQKPINFVSLFIKHYSKNKSVCLDLFMGSGSTMVACEQLSRKCYGMEIDPKYCQVIIDRMKKLNPKLTIKKNGILQK